jgi:hypothetical protein
MGGVVVFYELGFWGAAMTLSIKVAMFIAAMIFFASLNKYKPLQRALGLNRSLPQSDAFTLSMMTAGAFLLCGQGLFEFTLFDFMPEWVATAFYVLCGLSAVWQGSRQR